MAKEIQIQLTGKNAKMFQEVKGKIEVITGLKLTNVQVFMYIVNQGLQMFEEAALEGE